jgi:hypothetical protein
MKLEHVTFAGPLLDDGELIARLPADLAALLRQINGFIQFHGGLHVRGACLHPAWHSLRDAWESEAAFHRLYPAVRAEDIPFAEDCLGDQFLLRDGRVWRLMAETGEIEPLEVGLDGFFRAVEADPVEFLSLQPLLQFQQDGGRLEPGQLLSAAPPFCTEQPAEGVSLRAIPAGDRRRFLAGFAAQIWDVPDGGAIEFRVED